MGAPIFQRLSISRTAPIFIAAALVAAACGAATPSASPSAAATAAATAAPTPGPDVKVGVVSPFSGSVGFLGEYMANSLQIEIDKLNASGGLLGRKVVLVKRDDMLNPATSVTATRELIDSEKVAMVVGPSFTGNHAAVKQLINDGKVANCLPTVSGPQALENAPYTWRTQDPDLLREQDLFAYAPQKGVKKIALFTQDDDTGKGYAARLPDVAKKNGMELSASEFWRADDQDYTPQMLKIKNSGATAVLIATGNSTFAGRAVKAAQGLQYKPQFYGFSGLQGYTYMDQAGDWAVGTQFVAGNLSWFTEIAKDSWPKYYREHVEAVEKQYGVQVTGNSRQLKGTVLAADCIIEWSAAVKKAGAFDGPSVVKALETLTFTKDQTPSGIDMKFSPTNHEAYGPGSLFIYEWAKKPEGTYFLKQVKP